MEAFRRLGARELYYSGVGLLEALWKVAKVIGGSEEELSRIEEGVTAIRGTMKLAPATGEAVRAAMRMYKLGRRDLVDDLLYSIAASGGLRLLTAGGELIRFVEGHGLPRQRAMPRGSLTFLPPRAKFAPSQVGLGKGSAPSDGGPNGGPG